MKISRNKFLATVLILTAVLSMFGVVALKATNYINVNDYCWIEGVLHSDSYDLYPYAQESLDIGFSKYGEMIGYNEGTGIGLGLQYPGYHSAGDTYDQEEGTSVDPFANEEIDVDVWMNGWFIDIWYRKATGDWREIWAFAMFSDGALHGGSWIKMPEVDEFASNRPLWQRYAPFANPDSDTYPSPKPPYGGRKSNGNCVTDPITIVYNGPRKFIAVMKTRISDGATGLVDLYITLIFNKAEKNVIMLKDVKRLYDKGPLNVQFGNRGEWDLSPPSYVHFYTDEPVEAWDVDGDTDIEASTILPDEGHEFFFEYMSENKHPKKWWYDYCVDGAEGVSPSQYPTTVDGIQFNPSVYPFNEWFETQYTCYGREWHTDKTIKDHSYAVAQVIDSDAEYVGALAVWPHPEFWSVQNAYVNPYSPPASIPLMLTPISRMLNWHLWTVEEDPFTEEYLHGRLADRKNVWVKVDDMAFEPDIPFIIYEHDFKLQLGVADIYRIVSVYVLTDWHDADDYDANDLDGDSIPENKIDREIQYQLDEIFDPWDIYDAMHKNTKRWVEFFDRDYDDIAWDGETTYMIDLPCEKETEEGVWIPTLPVVRDGPWDAYCSFSERVLVNTGSGYELIWPHQDYTYDNLQTYHDPPDRDYMYDDYHMLDPIPYETTGDNNPYYTMCPYTGRISFYAWDSDTETYEEWYLPEDSIVKVEWSSEHHATAAEQWYLTELEETYRFSLHHDIICQYAYLTEVFLVDLGIPTALTSGDYIFYEEDSDALLYLRRPLPVGEWLLVTYNSSGTDYYEDWFYGEDGEDEDGLYEAWERNVYELTETPDDGTLEVWNTEVIEEVINETCYGSKPYGDYTNEAISTIWTPTNTTPPYTYKPDGTIGPPGDVKCPVPDEDWAGLPEYAVKTWLRYGWYGDPEDEIEYEECEWINLTNMLSRGEYIIRETSTCDELVLDQDTFDLGSIFVEEEQGYDARVAELKIVFKVPSGRWEWYSTGKIGDQVDALGAGMVTAAFKNKMIEIGIGGLDIQNTAVGPRVPWLVEDTISPDSLGRYHLYNDWCYSRTGDGLDTSWAITSSNIIAIGGTSVNMIGKYSNDWIQAITGTTGLSGYFAVTCWDRDTYVGGSVNDRYGYAAISTFKDKNGTVVLYIRGWTGQDTYYACKWFDEYKYWLQHINPHVTDLILKIEYKYSDGTLRCPPTVSIVEKLGTISEKPQHDP